MDGPLHFPGDEHEGFSILVPEVRVTPDTKVVDYGYHNLWVAIEVEGTGGYGTMYEVNVDVEATAHSNVLEVIKNYSAPSTLGPGSRLLVLANVELRLSNYSVLRGHVRSQSDELMEDLEHHLGSSQCEYLKVNLIYRHTAFPSTAPAEPSSVTDGSGADTSNTGNTGAGGVAGPQTKIRTTFSASITRHNAASPWSPPPAPAPSRLAGIVAAHWGAGAADELLQTRLARNRTARKTTYLSCPGGGGSTRDDKGEHDNWDGNTSSNRELPRRGFRELGAAPVDENERAGGRGGLGGGGGDYALGDGYDPASRIWARLRRGSGLGGGDYRGAMGSSKTSLTDMTNQQQQQKQAVGAEMLDRKMGVRKVSGKSRRGSGRWGFGNWWA